MQTRSGFTLIELSIVLVIIGLLIGGIIAGKELIENARVRAPVAQLQELSIAITTFRLKYNAVPGDLTEDESRKFGLPQYGNSDCFDFSGNGAIEHFWGDLVNYAINGGEPYRMIDELVMAGLFKAEYRRAAQSATTWWCTVGGADYYAKSKIKPSLRLMPTGYVNSVTGAYDGSIWMNFGVDMLSPGGWWNGGWSSTGSLLSPAQAMQLDLKLDDNVPATGNVVSVQIATPTGFAINTTASACSPTTAAATYNLARSDGICRLLVRVTK